MEYSENYLREYLPKEDPPFEFVPSDVLDEVIALERASRFETAIPEYVTLFSRATRWTYAIFSEMGLRQFALDRFLFDRWSNEFWLHGGLLVGSVDRASFGLFDAENEAPGLGIILDVPNWPGPPFLIVDYVRFPRLNNAVFPVAIRQSDSDLHLGHPANATGTCWAQCKDSALWGMITAGHVVKSNRPGRIVPMATGNSGALVRCYFQPVDAAFVQTDPPDLSLTELPVLSFPSVGMPVEVECQSRSVSRTIVEVANNCGVLHTRAIGILVYLDNPLNPGDSGALVRVHTGEAVGIYTGALQVPGAPSGQRGLAQNFEQAVFALNVTPYL